MREAIIKEIIAKLEASTDILLTAHHKLDPDSTGSMLALYRLCKKLGKRPVALCYEPVPPALEFLPDIKAIENNNQLFKDFIITLFNPTTEISEIKYTTKENGEVAIIVSPKHGQYSEKDVTLKSMQSRFDSVFVVDSGDKKNIGRLYEDNKEIFENATVINIDHHVSNDHFGDINLVDTKVSSASELVYYIISAIDPELIDADIATYLLLGIIADTGSFQHSNTTEDSLRVAADLVRRGGRQQDIIKNLYKTKKFSTLKLWGKVLSSLKSDKEARLVWATLPNKTLVHAQAQPEDIKGVVDDLMSSAPDTDFIILLTEIRPNTVSASIRTKSKDIDGVAIAKHFGGGGHTEAAGFTKEGTTLEQMEQEVLARVKLYQQEKKQQKPQEVPQTTSEAVSSEEPKKSEGSNEAYFAQKLEENFF